MWIPDEDFFSITLECDVPSTAKIDEWIVLDANRRSGPWRCVEESEVPDDVIAFPEPPPEMELHVAPSLRWKIEPDTFRMNVPSLDSIDFDTQFRKVMFLKPGTYRVQAITATPARDESEWYTIVVTA